MPSLQASLPSGREAFSFLPSYRRSLAHLSSRRNARRKAIAIAKDSDVYPACELQDIGRGRRPCRSILSISLIILKMCRHGGTAPTNTLFLNQTLVLTLTYILLRIMHEGRLLTNSQLYILLSLRIVQLRSSFIRASICASACFWAKNRFDQHFQRLHRRQCLFPRVGELVSLDNEFFSEFFCRRSSTRKSQR
ncbi:hypothetical protein Desti_1094 [Desulfomonile tiedjei DSM 6799]|uniref:Uncharacterized protein n=1 Tax=Desulfomonile tiedjei (strain ATCC 49306 / DSM 6799 / DCB-1) TaxID=706587 RepID=I4C2L7_DESTA|nr:hypothetical protein Desti_1094 [Desulfomonile tiedjei DSM 6799]